MLDGMRGMLMYDNSPSPQQYHGRFMGIISEHPSVSQSNRLHVDMFRFAFFFIKLQYTPQRWPIISRNFELQRVHV
jgi:hypothetical protein